MFLLVPAYPGCPGQTAVKWLLLLFLYLIATVALFFLHVTVFFTVLCHVYGFNLCSLTLLVYEQSAQTNVAVNVQKCR